MFSMNALGTVRTDDKVVPIYTDFGARSRHLGHGKVITFHGILWDVIT